MSAGEQVPVEEYTEYTVALRKMVIGLEDLMLNDKDVPGAARMAVQMLVVSGRLVESLMSDRYMSPYWTGVLK